MNRRTGRRAGACTCESCASHPSIHPSIHAVARSVRSTPYACLPARPALMLMVGVCVWPLSRTAPFPFSQYLPSTHARWVRYLKRLSFGGGPDHQVARQPALGQARQGLHIEDHAHSPSPSLRWDRHRLLTRLPHTLAPHPRASTDAYAPPPTGAAPHVMSPTPSKALFRPIVPPCHGSMCLMRAPETIVRLHPPTDAPKIDGCYR